MTIPEAPRGRVKPRGSQHIRLPAPRSILWGAAAFILFTLVGILVVARWSRAPEVNQALLRLAGGPIVILLALTALDHVLGGIRYRLFFDGRALPFISLWNCMRSNWANIFLGAVTPFQTGGGAAQLYILWRRGAKISEGTLVSLINLIATFVFFLFAAALAVLLVPEVLGDVSPDLVRAAFLSIAALGGLALLALALPQEGVAVIRSGVGRIPERFVRTRTGARRFAAVLVRELKYFRIGMRRILLRRKATLVFTLLTTVALYFNKYMIGYVLARSLGGWVPFGTVLGLQILQFLIIYFAPTPGASGFAELSSAWLMALVLAPELLLLYAVLWRCFTTLAGALVGAGVLFADLYAFNRTGYASRARALPARERGPASARM